MTAARARVQVAALIRAWVLLDFFGDARRSGEGHGSSLTTTIMWQSLLAFGFSVLLYPDVPPVAFVAANLSLSTLLMGVGSLGDEQRPLRRAADECLLAGAPVSRLSVALARSGHAAFHLVLVTAGMAISPAILLGHLTGSMPAAFGYVVMACACAGLASGALATLRALLASTIGDARATLLMGTVKAALLGGGFVLFALSLRQLDGTANDLPVGRLGAELLPMYHAARLLQAPGVEAWRLIPWGALALAMLLTCAGLRARRAPERRRAGDRRPLARLLAAMTGRGPARGVAEFVAAQMWRSPGFRARVLPLLGLPAGMVFLSLGGSGSGGGGTSYSLLCLLLMLPAIYLPFLIAFLPRADQAGTGWVFAHAPSLTRGLVSRATWRALTTHVLLPTYAIALCLVVAFGPARLERAAAAVFAFAVAVLAAEQMARIDRVPFTDDREEDRGLDLGVLMTGALALGLAGAAFGGMLPQALRWPVALLTLLSATQRLLRAPAADRTDALALHLEETVPGDPAQPDASEEGPPQRPEPTIRRELRAVAVLYVVLAVLPWLAGAAFAP